MEDPLRCTSYGFTHNLKILPRSVCLDLANTSDRLALSEIALSVVERFDGSENAQRNQQTFQRFGLVLYSN